MPTRTFWQILFSHLLNSDKPAWEFTFDTYALQPNYGTVPRRSSGSGATGNEAFVQVAGETAVLTGDGTAKQLEGKGYKPSRPPKQLLTPPPVTVCRRPHRCFPTMNCPGRLITEPSRVGTSGRRFRLANNRKAWP